MSLVRVTSSIYRIPSVLKPLHLNNKTLTAICKVLTVSPICSGPIVSACHCHTLQANRPQYNNHVWNTQNRNISSSAPQLASFSKQWKDLFKKPRFSKYNLLKAGTRLYMCLTELIDYNEFIKELDMADTFNSWYRITELHLWLLMVRMQVEEREADTLMKSVMETFNDDVKKRARILAKNEPINDAISNMSEEFIYSVYAYDRGLIGSDQELAEAVWSAFFHNKQDDPERVETLVHYIRKQVSFLDLQDTETLVGIGLPYLMPLKTPNVDADKCEKVHRQVLGVVPFA